MLHADVMEGKVDHHGQFFNVKVMFPHTSQIPVLISTLGKESISTGWRKSLMEHFHLMLSSSVFESRTAIPTLHTG